MTLTREEFLAELSGLLETDSALTGSEPLSDLGNWNSMAVLSFMAMADDKYGVTLSAGDIASCETVADLLTLVGSRRGA